MQISTLLSVTFLAVAFGSPVVKRDAATVEADIRAISSDIAAFQSSVSSFNGGLIGALAVDQAGSNEDTAIKKGTTDINASSTFSAADSTTVTNAATGLVPTIEGALNALVAKEPQFSSTGVNSIVVSQLNTLRSDSAAFSSALATKVQSSNTAAIRSAGTTVDAAFASAIAVFS